jgi:hypothetical protein
VDEMTESFPPGAELQQQSGPDWQNLVDKIVEKKS